MSSQNSRMLIWGGIVTLLSVSVMACSSTAELANQLSSTVQTPSPTKTVAQPECFVSKDNTPVNIRSQPNRKSLAVGEVRKNSPLRVTVTERSSNGWIKVTVEGWVNSEAVDKVPCP